VDAGQRVTWRELEQRVARVAGSLGRMGVGRGTRVATLAANSPMYLELLLAIWWCGGVIVPLNTRLAPGEIRYILEHADVGMLLMDEDMRSLGRQAESPRYPSFVADARFHGTLLAGEPIEAAAPDFEATAGIFYTGGTTGLPKGVELSQRNFAAAAAGMVRDLHLDATSVYLHAAPMFHLADFGTGMGVTMGAGAHSFLAKFSAEAVYQRLKEDGVTHLNLVPTMLAAVVDAPCRDDALLAQVRRVTYGAAPISPALLEKVLRAFPNAKINQFYGMTECCGASVFLAPERHVLDGPLAGKLKSAGQAIPDFELRIADEHGLPVPPGTVGEILMRGAPVMKGYWKDPEQTAKTLRGGWLHSGDAGYLDDDGFVFIVDRMKDMVISGGENIYCTEVENALTSHPAVRQCAVIGLPDDRWGERVHAVVVPAPGMEASFDDLDAHVRSRIAGYKVPRSYEFADELPLSGVGKVQKKLLRERCLRRQGAGA
jgi:acyl-CoA synthetase (AMP-forming)/AMP-acid ligase II